MKKQTELANRIRDARRRANLTQGDLGKYIGLSDKSISAYEQGRSVPPIQKLKALSQATNFPVSYFTHDEQEKTILKQYEAVEKEFNEVKNLLFELGK